MILKLVTGKGNPARAVLQKLRKSRLAAPAVIFVQAANLIKLPAPHYNYLAAIQASINSKRRTIMIVGILKEIKAEENRVSMTPAGVEIMVENGHTLLVEKAAGEGSGFSDQNYTDHGAEIVATPQEIFSVPKW